MISRFQQQVLFDQTATPPVGASAVVSATASAPSALQIDGLQAGDVVKVEARAHSGAAWVEVEAVDPAKASRLLPMASPFQQVRVTGLEGTHKVYVQF